MKLNPKVWLGIGLLACLGGSYLARFTNPYYLEVLITVGINIILAVSLNLVNGHTGQFSLGHAGFMAVGAYTAASITVFAGPGILAALPGPHAFSEGILFLVALLAGGITAAIAGLVVGMPSLRLRGDYLAIVTLGFGEIIRVIFQNMTSVGGASGLSGIPGYSNVFTTFAIAVVTIYTVTTLVNSTYGRGFLAVHDDEIAATAMGINTTRYKVTAFIIGAMFAGLAGGLWAHFKQYISPDGFGFMRSIEVVVFVILGGMGNTVGVIIAAIVLTVLPEKLRDFAEYRMIIYALLIIGLMLVRPQGLFGIRLRRQKTT